jgi:hypothetical protein
MLTRDCGKYYSFAVTTILFYDFLLTLPDEVSHAINDALRQPYYLSRDRSDMAGTGPNHGVRTQNHSSYSGH